MWKPEDPIEGTPEMIAAFEAKDRDALHEALCWHVWQGNPLDVDESMAASHSRYVQIALLTRRALVNAVASKRRQKMRRRG